MQTDPDRFAVELGSAFETIGFARLLNHPIAPELMAAAREHARRVFAYPDEVLCTYETPENGRQTGFTPLGIEKSRETPPELADIKRFWHVRDKNNRIPPIFPDKEVPEFGPTMRSLFEAMFEFSTGLLVALNTHLGFEDGFLPNMTRGGDTLLRVLHYPPVPDETPKGAVRSGKHEDINLITLLVPAEGGGLEVQALDGTWFSALEQPDEIVVDASDMLQLLTGGRLDENWSVQGGRIKAITHRVVNPGGDIPNGDRFSFPTFVHPNGTTPLGFIEVNGERYTVTDGQYLMRRLYEIGLINSTVYNYFFSVVQPHPLVQALAT